jgi:hypothetical protein
LLSVERQFNQPFELPCPKLAKWKNHVVNIDGRDEMVYHPPLSCRKRRKGLLACIAEIEANKK